MKIKPITKEQYLALAELGMPVTALFRKTEDRTILHLLTDPDWQLDEHYHYKREADKCKVFYTLVEGESCDELPIQASNKGAS